MAVDLRGPGAADPGRAPPRPDRPPRDAPARRASFDMAGAVVLALGATALLVRHQPRPAVGLVGAGDRRGLRAGAPGRGRLPRHRAARAAPPPAARPTSAGATSPSRSPPRPARTSPTWAGSSSRRCSWSRPSGTRRHAVGGLMIARPLAFAVAGPLAGLRRGPGRRAHLRRGRRGVRGRVDGRPVQRGPGVLRPRDHRLAGAVGHRSRLLVALAGGEHRQRRRRARPRCGGRLPADDDPARRGPRDPADADGGGGAGATRSGRWPPTARPTWSARRWPRSGSALACSCGRAGRDEGASDGPLGPGDDGVAFATP